MGTHLGCEVLQGATLGGDEEGPAAHLGGDGRTGTRSASDMHANHAQRMHMHMHSTAQHVQRPCTDGTHTPHGHHRLWRYGAMVPWVFGECGAEGRGGAAGEDTIHYHPCWDGARRQKMGGMALHGGSVVDRWVYRVVECGGSIGSLWTRGQWRGSAWTKREGGLHALHKRRALEIPRRLGIFAAKHKLLKRTGTSFSYLLWQQMWFASSCLDSNSNELCN